jgi:outer membrane protein insertion porin family
MKRLLTIILLFLIAGLSLAQNNDVLLDYRLRKVFYNGNTSFKDRQLKRYVDIKPVTTKRAMKRITYRFIKSQAKSLQNYYISEGFLNCSVRDSLIVNQKNELHLYFNINENERFTLKQISIEDNTLLSDGEILELLGVKVGEPFRQYIYYSNFKKILAKYSEMGHPFAGIREEYDWGTDLEITLYINEDVPYDVNKITIDGNKTVDDPFIRKHFMIKEGKPYNLEKINRTKDRIYEMGAFNSVNIVPVNPDTSEQTLDLDVSVIESKTRRFDLELGTEQGTTKKISSSSLYIQPEWTHKNLFRRAHRFKVGVTYKALIQNNNIENMINSEIAYTVPWLFVLRLPTTFKVYYDRDAYDPFAETTTLDTIINGEIQTEYGINMSSIWRYNRNIYTRFSVSLRNFKSELKTDLDIDITKPFEPQAEISIQSRFDNRDSFIYPTKGWNILLYGGYVLGADSSTTTEYFRVDASVNGYIPLARNIVLAGRLEAGQFFDMKSIDPLVLYQLGSESTIRGWRKTIGNKYILTTTDTIYAGAAKLMANVELRADLIWNFGVNAFLDVGMLDNDFSGIMNWSDYYVNTGFGIYYKTPIGPVRIEFPIILNNPNEGLDRDLVDKTFWNYVNIGLLFAF